MYPNLKRLYTDQLLNPNNHITLTDKQCHYIKNVMRLGKNEFIRLFNGKEGEWLAKIIKIEKKNILLSLEKKICEQTKCADLWLLFAPIKKDKLNILVQKSTELGVTSFIPIKTERTNIKNINIDNLQQNAIEASQQSERLEIPIVQEEKKLKELVQLWPNDRCLLYCDERNLKAMGIITTMNKIKKKFTKWSVIIGPEGGFSSIEKEIILNLKNAYAISLGKRILRSDTAATVVIFSIQNFIVNFISSF